MKLNDGKPPAVFLRSHICWNTMHLIHSHGFT